MSRPKARTKSVPSPLRTQNNSSSIPALVSTVESHKGLVWALVLAMGLMLLTRSLNGLMFGMHEVGTSAAGIWGRNHVHYGLGYTKLYCVWNDCEGTPETMYPYLDRPPLTGFWVALPMLIFGDHVWVIRMVIIAVTLTTTWLLMVMIGRLQSTLLAGLAGLFFVLLPMVGYFGRVLQFESLAPIFILFMLHGYLQWAQFYGPKYRPRAGFWCYIIAAVLGILTDWEPVIMAGLIWICELCRVVMKQASWRNMIWLTFVPAISLILVFIHALWAVNWDMQFPIELFTSRTYKNPITWARWIPRNWMILLWGFSWFGVVAAIAYLAIIPAILRWTKSDSLFRLVVPNAKALVPIFLLTLQGLIWVLGFKRQSYIHEFWQYQLSFFFAVAMASVLLAAYITLSRWSPRWATLGIVVLFLAPMPFMTMNRDAYYEKFSDNIRLKNRMNAYIRLAEICPPRTAVMASEPCPPGDRGTFGSYTNMDPFPNLAYYINRPLIAMKDIKAIEANRDKYPFYVLELLNDTKVYKLARELNTKYNFVNVGDHHLIYDLRRPKKK